MASFNSDINCLHVYNRSGQVHVYLDGKFTCSFNFSSSSKIQLSLNPEIAGKSCGTERGDFNTLRYFLESKPVFSNTGTKCSESDHCQNGCEGESMFNLKQENGTQLVSEDFSDILSNQGDNLEPIVTRSHGSSHKDAFAEIMQDDITQNSNSVPYSTNIQEATNSLEESNVCSIQDNNLEFINSHDSFAAVIQNDSLQNISSALQSQNNQAAPNCLEKTHEEEFITTLECEFCSRHFGTETEFRSHMEDFKKNPSTCKICNESFDFKGDLLYHEIKIHYEHGGTTRCCNKQFTVDRWFHRHLFTRHTKEKNYRCCVCARSFLDKQGVKRHCLSTHSSNIHSQTKNRFTKPNINHSFSKLSEDQIEDAHSQTRTTVSKSHIVHSSSQSNKDHNEKDIEISQNPYFCEFCKRQFTSEKELRSHTEIAEQIPSTCKKCNVNFKSKAELLFHEIKIHNQDSVCPICHKEFKKSSTMKNHLNYVHTKETKFCCCVCGVTLHKRFSLLQHCRTFHSSYNQCQRTIGQDSTINDTVVQFHDIHELKKNGKGEESQSIQSLMKQKDLKWKKCEYCHTEFKSKAELFRHIENACLDESLMNKDHSTDSFPTSGTDSLPIAVHSYRPFKRKGLRHLFCVYCQKQFKTESQFKSHIEYLDNIPSTCKVCHENFDTKAALIFHDAKLHSLEKHRSGMCPVCQKQFKDDHFVQKHINRIHTKETFYLCCVCGFRVSKRDFMYKHCRKKHCKVACKKGKKFTCGYCGEKFSEKAELSSHYTKQHSKTCLFCFENFYLIKHLQRHYKEKHSDKVFSCDHCDKVFPTMQSRLNHKRNIRWARRQTCHKCGKNVVGHSHIKSCGNEDKSECQVCGKFVSNSRLKHHLANHEISLKKCHICAKVFRNEIRFRQHLIRKHEEKV